MEFFPKHPLSGVTINGWRAARSGSVAPEGSGFLCLRKLQLRAGHESICGSRMAFVALVNFFHAPWLQSCRSAIRLSESPACTV